MSNATQGSAKARIEMILDDNSFVETGAMVTARATDFNMQSKKVSSDGVITGYGTIEGKLVYVYSQDASVLNGSVGEMHAKKIVHIYDMAVKMGAPVIGLLDCAGLRLQESCDALNGFGEIYLKQSKASGVIPQISVVYGSCGGGLAVMTALSDFTFMEQKKAMLFVNSPNVMDENNMAKINTTSAEFQCKEAGIVDFVGDESDIAKSLRELLTMLPSNNEDNMPYQECTDDLNRLCMAVDTISADTALLIREIADNHKFLEVKGDFAKSMVTGFIRLNGTTIGVVANRTSVYDANGNISEKFDPVITASGAYKAEEFVNFCDAFEIPVLTFTNTRGFEATVASEKTIARAMGKLTFAFAEATVPKVNVIIGEAYGSAYVSMNSKSIGADMVYAWENASIGMMNAESAVKIIYSDEINDAGDMKAFISEKSAEYSAMQSSVESAASRGYVDAVIPAEETRKYVTAAFEMLFSKKEDRPFKKHGTV